MQIRENEKLAQPTGNTVKQFRTCLFLFWFTATKRQQLLKCRSPSRSDKEKYSSDSNTEAYLSPATNKKTKKNPDLSRAMRNK